MKELPECDEEVIDKITSTPARPPEVWEQRERDGRIPKLPDCPACVEEHGSVVRHFARSSSSLRTLPLDAGYWADLSLDGKRYFVAAGIRVSMTSMVCWFRFHAY